MRTLLLPSKMKTIARLACGSTASIGRRRTRRRARGPARPAARAPDRARDPRHRRRDVDVLGLLGIRRGVVALVHRAARRDDLVDHEVAAADDDERDVARAGVAVVARQRARGGGRAGQRVAGPARDLERAGARRGRREHAGGRAARERGHDEIAGALVGEVPARRGSRRASSPGRAGSRGDTTPRRRRRAPTAVASARMQRERRLLRGAERRRGADLDAVEVDVRGAAARHERERLAGLGGARREQRLQVDAARRRARSATRTSGRR